MGTAPRADACSSRASCPLVNTPNITSYITSSQSGGAQSSLVLHRRALMARSQRRAREHCGRRMTSSNWTSLGARCPASDFVELLGATRAQTSGLARCHGAAGELHNGYVQKTGCLKLILETNPGVCRIQARERLLICRSDGGLGMQLRRVGARVVHGQIPAAGGKIQKCGVCS